MEFVCDKCWSVVQQSCKCVILAPLQEVDSKHLIILLPLLMSTMPPHLPAWYAWFASFSVTPILVGKCCYQTEWFVLFTNYIISLGPNLSKL